jgi:bifunctional non-homologous end joining protein LigD
LKQREIWEVMACDVVDDYASLPGGADSYSLEPKFDGFRLVLHHERALSVAMYTREGKRQEKKLPHIAEAMTSFPPGTVLDGEIVAFKSWTTGKVEPNFERVQSVMLSLPERSVALQEEGGPLTFYCFDILRAGDKNMMDRPYEERTELMQQWFVGHATPHFLPVLQGIARQDVHDSMTHVGWEGTVAKRKSSPYVLGGTKGWYKFKAMHTVDVTVTGFTKGDGKYADTIGAIVFAQPDEDGVLVERGQCSGMTDAVRYGFLDEGKGFDRRLEFVGQTIEVRHMGLMKGRVKFRHPQFKRFRPDKPKEQVKWHDR